MGYHYHGGDTAVIEVFPVSGKSTAAAGKVGLEAAAIPTLLVQGDNKPGLGHAVAEAVAEAGINIAFLVAQVIGDQFSAVMGFDNEMEAKRRQWSGKPSTSSKSSPSTAGDSYRSLPPATSTAKMGVHGGQRTRFDLPRS